MSTIATLIQRVIDDVRESHSMKQFGDSQLCTLRRLQSAPIGRVRADALKKQDVIDHCKLRRKEVCAATVGQDISYLRSALNHAADTFTDCDGVSAAAIEAARHFLVKHGLTGKSTPRKRRPTDEEIARILAEAAEYAKHPRCTLKALPDLIAFALVSSRRRGELVRMTHGDVDYERKVYMVRDLKHPTKKKGNDKRFILWPELEAIIRRQPRTTNDPAERIFPYEGKTLGKAYIEIKKRLGITDLRFHDNRREAISRWLKKLSPQDVRIAVSGHENTLILERNYDGRDALELVRDKVGGIAA